MKMYLLKSGMGFNGAYVTKEKEHSYSKKAFHMSRYLIQNTENNMVSPMGYFLHK